MYLVFLQLRVLLARSEKVRLRQAIEPGGVAALLDTGPLDALECGGSARLEQCSLPVMGTSSIKS